MRATGIVRRVDDLGRVVIPKEIRQSLGIKEGCPLELWLDKDAIVLKKYDVITPFEDRLKAVIEALNDEDIARMIPVEDRDVVKAVMTSIMAKWKQESNNAE